MLLLHLMLKIEQQHLLLFNLLRNQLKILIIIMAQALLIHAEYDTTES